LLAVHGLFGSVRLRGLRLSVPGLPGLCSS